MGPAQGLVPGFGLDLGPVGGIGVGVRLGGRIKGYRKQKLCRTLGSQHDAAEHDTSLGARVCDRASDQEGG